MHLNSNKSKNVSAFTLVETLISVLIMGLVFAGTLVAYTRAAERAEWSGYSLAAQAQCTRVMEQFHSVLWDTQVVPNHDDTTNIPSPQITVLDIPMKATNAVWVTNTSSVTTITNSGPSYYKMITVQTTWPWKGKTFTNTLVTYRAPDQ
jgi:Tfp pilus assembly protein PilE